MDISITATEIAERLGARLSGDGGANVTDITHDSRTAGSGALFVAIRGRETDGHRFIPDVIERGAVGVISEDGAPAEFDGVWLQVPDARAAMAQAASAVFGDPSRGLDLIGITGTNGKTTTTYLCFSVLQAAGRAGSMLTTVEYRIGDESMPATRTTPEVTDTNRFLSQSLDRGCDFSVMESASLAMDQRRCDGLRYRVAVFTNLTRDHLDYHGTMENYFDAKKRLFDGRLGEPPESSVVNIDDEYGRRIADEIRARGGRLTTYAIDREADLTATEISVSLMTGTSFTLKTSVGGARIHSPLVGRPHVYNTLAAIGTALELGIPLDRIVEGVAKCKGAPGRFERVENEKGFAVVVDYAHTDDALENTIRTARSLTDGRVITLFGCGGDRDKTKRAPMGRIAGELSDFSVLTSDNPRSEDPVQILREIEEGTKAVTSEYALDPDRRSAIALGLRMARPGDVVLICGKGHENYQIIGNQTNHFDDREVAEEILSTL